MQLARLRDQNGAIRVGVVNDDQVVLLPVVWGTLADALQRPELQQELRQTIESGQGHPLNQFDLLAPVDRQEVWAAGVTYKRSQVARMEESAGAAQFYDKVYAAERPEIFFKATPHRVVGPGAAIRVRADSHWTVPEPELALMLTPNLELVGFTIGNDVSARDIEGENPLYLPQAKVYNECAAIGPFVTLREGMPEWNETSIRLEIERAATPVFDSSTTLASLHRTVEDLIHWLGKENSFPDGAILFTGTGIVPPDDFTLTEGDVVRITIDGIGTLENPVVQSVTS